MSHFRIAFTITADELGTILSLISDTAKDLSINEVKPTQPPQPTPFQSKHIRPNRPCNSGIWAMIRETWAIGEIFRATDAKAAMQNTPYSPQSAGSAVQQAIDAGEAERIGFGVYRRIK